VTTTPRVAIHYRRLPDHTRVYDQRVLLEQDDVVVTLSEPLAMEAPMVHDQRVMLEPGSLVVWFTFPEAWHDIGHFYAADGRSTGLYANVITPPVMEGSVWHTTDLFLDLWWPREGAPTILDEDEFENALAKDWLDEETAHRARAEADRLLALATAGAWPPPVVGEWTLGRALAEVG